MDRLNYIIKRIIQIIPVMLIISVLIFASMRMIGGDPARLMLGEKATESAIAALREKLGLNEPIAKQYLIFMKDILKGDMGTSLTYQRPVSELLSNRLPTTIKLSFLTTLISIIVAIPLGYLAGTFKDKTIDQVIRVIALVFISMPSFWVGLILMIIFAVNLSILPAGGWGETAIDQIKSLLLPSITQSLTTIALVIRNVRNSVVDISSMDYVDFARSKGLDESAVRNRYILKNSMISTVTLFSMRIAAMLGGSVIIESVFSLPGIGKLMVDSIFGRDYVVVQSLVLLFAFLVLTINIITDIIYSFIDPRVTLK